MLDYGLLIQRIAILALPIIFAVTLHEIAHGWVANKLGDPTARLMGRLTLNPLAHIDPFGTIILPLLLVFSSAGLLFGYAKPVPVNSRNLRNPKRDMIWVAAAGPATNLLLATVSALLFRLLITFALSEKGIEAFLLIPLKEMMKASVQINILLAVINFVPIPPADGGRIAVGVLPRHLAEPYSRVEPYGMLLLMVLIFFDPFGIYRQVVWPFIRMLYNILLLY